MANLRAGLVGLGVMGRHHLRLLNALDGVDFVGVADPGLPLDSTDVTTFPSLEALIGSGVEDQSECTDEASDRWYFASANTELGAGEVDSTPRLWLLNPFPVTVKFW